MALSLQQYKDEVILARQRICGITLKTPLLKSNWLSEKTKCHVYLKMESEQITRSFKLRGATNKLKKMTEGVSVSKPFITASSGNHGLACAYVSSLLNLDMTVYTYKGIAKAKEEEITQYPGVKLVKHGIECCEGETEARRQSEVRDIPYISPYNDNDVISGQGTIGMELLEQLPELDAVFVPVGGGGLIGGVAAFIKACKPSIKVVGCQPVNDASMYHCIKNGSILTDNPIKDTFSSGTAGRVEVGSVTFDICKEYVDEWVLVEEEFIEEAVYNMLNKEKKLVEGAAGLGVASFLKVHDQYCGKNIAIVICGANIGICDVQKLINKFQT